MSTETDELRKVAWKIIEHDGHVQTGNDEYPYVEFVESCIRPLLKKCESEGIVARASKEFGEAAVKHLHREAFIAGMKAAETLCKKVLDEFTERPLYAMGAMSCAERISLALSMSRAIDRMILDWQQPYKAPWET